MTNLDNSAESDQPNEPPKPATSPTPPPTPPPPPPKRNLPKSKARIARDKAKAEGKKAPKTRGHTTSGLKKRDTGKAARQQRARSTAKYAHDTSEPDRCHASRKSDRGRCRNASVPGRLTCRYHGGTGGRPVVHGRYSAALGRLTATYESSLEDAEGLFDLTDTLAAMNAVLERQMQLAASADTPEWRKNALEIYREIEKAQEEGETVTSMTNLLYALGQHLRAGARESSTLETLTRSIERMATRQEKAWGVRLSASQAINARDLIAILGRIVTIIADEAPTDAAASIVRRIDAEIMAGGSQLPGYASSGA